MKKLLLGATALVCVAAFSAPAFAADRIKLGLRGYFTGGIAYADVDEPTQIDPTVDPNTPRGNFEEVLFGSDSEIHFRGKTTLDNGLQIGFRAEFELERDSGQDANDNEDDFVDEVYLQIDGGFGRVQFGQQDGVQDQMIFSAPNVFEEVTISSIDMDPFETQMDYISDNLNDGNERNLIDTSPDFTDDNTKLIYFTPRIAGLQVGVSYTPVFGKNSQGFRFNEDFIFAPNPANILDDSFGNNYFEIAGNYVQDLGPVKAGISASYGTGEGANAADDPEEFHVGAQIEFAGVTVGGAYKQANVAGSTASVQDTKVLDAGVTYETGPWTFGIAYGQSEGLRDDLEAFRHDDELDQKAIIGGVARKFGPGMEIGIGGMWFSDQSRKINRTNQDVIFNGDTIEPGETILQGDEIDAYAIFTELNINF